MIAARVIHPGNLQCFLAEYREQLAARIKSHPGDYHWPHEEFEQVFARMSAAIERGSYNKDSAALRATCKALGIKHTYKAIGEFIAL